MHMPTLETERLVIRPFTEEDLDAAHRILDVELGEADLGYESAKGIEERGRWLRWTVMNYEELAKLEQPPYGDRAVTLRRTGQMVGACGYVPCLGPFDQLRSPPAAGSAPSAYTTEFGLYYAVSPAFQRRGYATEAARALLEYAFRHLRLKHVVAMTTIGNVASVRVMEKLGMRVERNPHPEPPWFQVVGIKDKDEG